MFSLFAPKLPIDEDELEWQLATFKWLGTEFGDLGPDAKLVLPTADHFPPSRLTGQERATELFDQVRLHAGMTEWNCVVEPGAAGRPLDAGNSHLLRHEGSAAPCGTFSVTGEGDEAQVVITYNPDLVRNPEGLVATFAHELAHYLMSTAATAPPGGWELHELHTDLCAVYLGFGIFLANHARSFSQFQSGGETGWSSSVQGYLSEGALVTATAIFERLCGRDPMVARPFFKDYLRSDLKRAGKAFERRYPDMDAAVAAVDLSAFAD